MAEPIVIFRIDERGEWSMQFTAGVTVYSVDERCEGDRVYQFTRDPLTADEVKAILGDSPVGVLGDRPVVERAIRAMLSKHDGERLRLVPKEP